MKGKKPRLGESMSWQSNGMVFKIWSATLREGGNYGEVDAFGHWGRLSVSETTTVRE